MGEQDFGGEVASLLSADFITEHMTDDLVAASVRLPRERIALLDAMSKKAGVSRNRMINMLISAGISDVFSRLPAEVVHDLHEAVVEDL
jgi:predicted DNA-binding protein